MIMSRVAIAGDAVLADPALWTLGVRLADRHRLDPGGARCQNVQCTAYRGYPCPRRRTADHLVAASAAGWPQRWTARIDALSAGAELAAVMPAASADSPPIGHGVMGATA